MRNQASIVCVVAVSALAFAGVALSADLDTVSPAPVPAPPASGWEGGYVGLFGAYSTGFDLSVESESATTVRAGPSESSPADIRSARDVTTASASARVEGVFGGAVSGYNVQSGPLVFGFEGDIGVGHITPKSLSTSSRAFTGLAQVDTGVNGLLRASGDTMATTTARAKLDWYATLRGRIGVAHGEILVYATGGGAFGKVGLDGRVDADQLLLGGAFVGSDLVFSDTVMVNQSTSFSETSIEFGWTLGGGVDIKVNDEIVLGAFYRYVDFGTVSARSSALTATMPDPPDFEVNWQGDSAAFGRAEARVYFHAIGLRAVFTF